MLRRKSDGLPNSCARILINHHFHDLSVGWHKAGALSELAVSKTNRNCFGSSEAIFKASQTELSRFLWKLSSGNLEGEPQVNRRGEVRTAAVRLRVFAFAG